MKSRRSLSVRVKVLVVSVLSFVVTTACSWLRVRSTPEPNVTCYTMSPPTNTPTPVVMCYTMPPPTNTPTPMVMCYEAMIPTETPTSTTFTSPISPLPTPTPTASTSPLPTPEARQSLLEQLLAEGRFPEDVARELKS